MERASGTEEEGLTISQLTVLATPPTGSRNMSLEMIQDKRGPYLCISGVDKSLACLPAAEKIPGMQGFLSPSIPKSQAPLSA